MKPHKHSELIKQWADGAEIEFKYSDGGWNTVFDPSWHDVSEYRIKPEPKPDYFLYAAASSKGFFSTSTRTFQLANIKLTFSGETGKLKSAEVLK